MTSAAVIAMAALSAPAFAANVTGEVDVYGHVTPTCAVVTSSSPSTSFTDTINLGELAKADGTLNTAVNGTSNGVQVMCNSSAPKLTLSATGLVGEAPAPDASYTNHVGYTAHLKVTETGGNVETVSNVADSAATNATMAAPFQNAPDNVVVVVDTLTATGVLTAGQYGVASGAATASGGVISIVITPN
jgi:hypothetical protein